MRLLWRISNHCDIQGMGGEKSDGRWHTAKRGKRIVYLSDHPAIALIEVLANLKGQSEALSRQLPTHEDYRRRARGNPCVRPQ